MGDRQAAPASGCDWNPSVCSGARPCRAGRPRQAGRSGEGTAAGGQSHGVEVQSKGRGREGDAAREARGSGRGRAGRREDRGCPGPGASRAGRLRDSEVHLWHSRGQAVPETAAGKERPRAGRQAPRQGLGSKPHSLLPPSGIEYTVTMYDEGQGSVKPPDPTSSHLQGCIQGEKRSPRNDTASSRGSLRPAVQKGWEKATRSARLKQRTSWGRAGSFPGRSPPRPARSAALAPRSTRTRLNQRTDGRNRLA